MSALLEARDLSVAVPGTGWRQLVLRQAQPLILRDINLAIRPGVSLAVVGESGAGKSTLARALMGLMEPSAGEILYKDQPLTAPGVLKQLRREVRFLFQNPMASLNPRMRVGELIAEPIRIHEPGHCDIKGEVARLLEAVGLAPRFAARYPHELSGGQAGRVCVARALAVRPELIVADEPTAGFDVSVQAEILNLLAELQAKFGLAMLVITHDLGVVRHFSDEIAVLYRGRIVETGPTEKIFAHPQDPYTAELLTAFKPVIHA